jgi:hypothetical protein
MMDQDRFAALAERYGGDIARWPEPEQVPARDFLAEHPERAWALLRAESALDDLLAEGQTFEPPAALFATIAQSGVAARRQPQPVWWASAAAIVLSVGLGAGWFSAPVDSRPDEDVYAAAFATLDEVDTLSLEEGA